MAFSLSGLWAELRRRKVVRVAIAYVIVGWVLVEAASVVFPMLLLPDWSTRLVLALALLGFPIALALAWALDVTPEGIRRERSRSGPQPGSAGARPGSVDVDQRRSILVMPFTNMSDSAENEYFSDGITEEILNLLARQPDLRVASRTTTFCFKNCDVDLRTIVERMGADMLLEGSVRRAGNRVRIIAQLIDAGTDAHIWSESFDREIEDIFTVQAEIARSIVGAMELEHAVTPRLPAAPGNIEAYDYYLRGRQYMQTISGRGLGIARTLFTRAIEADPQFARAYAGLADAEALTAQWFDRTPEHLEAADRASRKALELAPGQAEAHASRGFALSLKGDFAAASREFERALALDPQNYDALNMYGRSRFAEGRLREAAELWARAHASQPDEFQALALRTTALEEIDPEAAYENSLRAAEAIRRRLELNPDDLRALSLGAGVLVTIGRVEEGLEMARRVEELAPDDISVLYNAACSYARAGDHEQALRTLERRLDLAGTIYREWVEHDADFAGMRDDPRFRALLERMPRVGT